MVIQEKDIERNFIERLVALKYTYRDDIRDRISLEKNFREKFEALNQVRLTDSEFARLRDEIVTSDVFVAAKRLREPNTFMREDGTPLHYTLVNIKYWCKNEFEVIHQLRMNTEASHHRYDVILLINGIPVTQIELKTLEISPRRAMEQIVDYKNAPGNGYSNTILCFIQLFIVSNRTNTYYFANNNTKHFAFNADERFLPIYQHADKKNIKVTHLNDFTDCFLPKCTLAELISRYMVLVVSEQKILVMRPYQIYAVKAIVDCIDQNRGNGYIWHTTGSGKTLTSFKAATLLKENDSIDKCLFVVDRKDLDRQTREEFNKFQEKCVEENTNTRSLVYRLTSDDFSNKIIVTTIQKLGLALSDAGYRSELEKLSKKRVVFIFDECHRSQFGDNHNAIKDFFPHAQLFGFTGTPIFEENSNYKRIDGIMASYVTTKDIFQKELHSYTITNAIDDRNVLKFHIDFFKPEKEKKSSEDLKRAAIVNAILDKHNVATNNRRFNALFATSSINEAIEHYALFKIIQDERKSKDPEYQPFNVACIFSPPSNGDQDVKQLQEDLPQEKEDNEQDPEGKKESLTRIIEDYNKLFKTNHKITEFDFYYQDLQKRIKDQQYSNKDYPHSNKIDIVIVVDMLLTGFDSKYLNTLYVDKNLKHHGLIQAFSRTNRVLNDTKPYGNILDFRNQQDSVDEAIKLFSGQEGERAKQIWIVEPASVTIKKFTESISKLETFMESQDLECIPEEINNLKGDAARADFINHFKEVQKLKTQIDQYTDLTDEQREEIEETIDEDSLRGFRSMYLDVAENLRNKQGKHKNVESTELDNLDFEYVLFSSAIVDYDYIMKLISQYTRPTAKTKMTREQLISLLKSHSNFNDEREDMIDYINTLKVGDGLSENDIKEGYIKFKEEKFHRLIEEIAKKHGLDLGPLNDFVQLILDRMVFDGEKLSDLLEPLDLGWKARKGKEEELMEELVPVLKKLANGRDISGLGVYE